MEDEPQGFFAVFHQVDDQVVCWMLEDLEMTCFDYPLDNGLMVNEYDYKKNGVFGILYSPVDLSKLLTLVESA